MGLRKTPNATRVPVDIVGSSTFGRYQKISSALTMNMFVSDEWLVNFAGYRRVLDVFSSGEGRGLFHSIRGNFLLVVINAQVFTISASLGVTVIGNLGTGSGEVFIDENLNSQICIVDGVNAYIYNYSLPPNITNQGLPFPPNYVCYHNTYFLFGNGDITSSGSAWYVYGYSAATAITQLAQLALQTKPDYALAVVRLPGQGNNIMVMGSAVCELFTNVQNPANSSPIYYRRNSTVNVDYGCLSVSTIATSDKYVAWLAVNENNAPTIMVYTGQGYTPISTDGIDFALSQIKFPSQSTAMFYRQDGHLFYQLTFYNPADNVTFSYDFTTEKFFNLSDSYLNYHPARNFAYFNGRTYFISLNNASLYESSTLITANNENIYPANDPTLINNIQRIRICSSIRMEDSAPFISNSLAVTIEQGVDQNYIALPYQNFIITEDISVPIPPLPPPAPQPPPAPYPGQQFTVADDDVITEWGENIVDQDSWFGASIDNNLPYVPRVDLSLSRDGGVTWSNTVARNLHPIGWRMNILTWKKLGAANDITMKFRFWGLSRFVVNNGMLDVY